MTSSHIQVPVSPGELLDKLTILEIKSERISDSKKLENIRREQRLLSELRHQSIPSSDRLQALTAELKTVNEALWEIEDAIRVCEREQRFDADFIRLARDVYLTNDRRAEIKREINGLLGSGLQEEKSYAPYGSGFPPSRE